MSVHHQLIELLNNRREHFQSALCSVSVSVSVSSLLLSEYVTLLSSYLQTSDENGVMELSALKLSEVCECRCFQPLEHVTSIVKLFAMM